MIQIVRHRYLGWWAADEVLHVCIQDYGVALDPVLPASMLALQLVDAELLNPELDVVDVACRQYLHCAFHAPFSLSVNRLLVLDTC